MTSEIWKPVLGYEGLYEVSSDGRVRSLDRLVRNTATSSRLVKGQVIAPYIREAGYHTVKLAKARKKTSHYVHRLVATAFHGPGQPNEEVLHGDGNKGNNCERNLSWGTRLDNMADRERLQEAAKGERHGMAKLGSADALAIRSDSRTHAAIASDYGVSRRLVGMIKAGRIWRHLGG